MLSILPTMTLQCLIENHPDLFVVNIASLHFSLEDALKFARVSHTARIVSRHDFFWSKIFRERKWMVDCIPITGDKILQKYHENSLPIQQMSLKMLKNELQGRGVELAGLFEKSGNHLILEDTVSG